jgi:hypothetical protein
MSGGGNTQTSVSEPWTGQQPYFSDIMSQAQQWYYGGGPQYYPNSTVVPFSPQTEQALGMMEQRAVNGDPSTDALGNYVTSTLGTMPTLDSSTGFAGIPETAAAATTGLEQLGATAGGDFLGAGNPYLDNVYNTGSQQIMDQFEQQIMPSLNATFGASGRTGSGTHQLLAGEAAGDVSEALAGLYGDIYMPAYESERDRMLSAAGQLQQGDIERRGVATDIYGTMGDQAFRAGTLAPTYTDMQYQDLDRLLGVGGTIEGQAQRLLQDDISRWDFNQQAPYNNLSNYANLIYGMPGGYGTTTATGPSSSPLGSAAGGAMLGASVIPGPIGAGIGGVAGLLAGFL